MKTVRFLMHKQMFNKSIRRSSQSLLPLLALLFSSMAFSASYPPILNVVDNEYVIDGSDLFPTPKNALRDSVDHYADLDLDGQLDYIYRRNSSSSSCDDILIRLTTQNLPFDALDSSTNYLPKITGFTDFVTQRAIAYPTCYSPRAIADINQDGIPDIEIRITGLRIPIMRVYVYGMSTNTIDVDINSMTSQQGFYTEPGFGIEPLWDLNGDGLTDFKVIYPDAPFLLIIKGRHNVLPGDTDFFDFSTIDILVQVNLSRGQSSFTIKSAGDMDGDGDVETIVSDYSHFLRFIDGAPGLSINVNSFTDLPTFPMTSCTEHRCRAFPIGDIDGDQLADILLVDEGFASPSSKQYDSSGEQVNNETVDTSIIYGTASGFSSETSVNTSSDYPSGTITQILDFSDDVSISSINSMAVGDMTGDGLDEFMYTSNNDTYLLIGNNDRPDSIHVDSLNGENGFRPGLAPYLAGDINADGLVDLIAKPSDFYSLRHVPRRIVLGQPDSPDSMLAPTLLKIRKAPEGSDFFWQVQGDEIPAGFVVYVSGREYIRLPGWRRSLIIKDQLTVNEQSKHVSIASMDDNGTLSPKSSVNPPSWLSEIANLRATVYSSTAAELFFSSGRPGQSSLIPTTSAPKSIVWRNGEAIAEIEAWSYFDTDLSPGKTYTYVVTTGPAEKPAWAGNIGRSGLLTLQTDNVSTELTATHGGTNKAPVPLTVIDGSLPTLPLRTGYNCDRNNRFLKQPKRRQWLTNNLYGVNHCRLKVER